MKEAEAMIEKAIDRAIEMHKEGCGLAKILQETGLTLKMYEWVIEKYEEGKRLGEAQYTRWVAANMIRHGVETDIIMRCTGVDEQLIEEIRLENKKTVWQEVIEGLKEEIKKGETMRLDELIEKHVNTIGIAEIGRIVIDFMRTGGGFEITAGAVLVDMGRDDTLIGIDEAEERLRSVAKEFAGAMKDPLAKNEPEATDIKITVSIGIRQADRRLMVLKALVKTIDGVKYPTMDFDAYAAAAEMLDSECEGICKKFGFLIEEKEGENEQGDELPGAKR